MKKEIYICASVRFKNRYGYKAYKRIIRYMDCDITKREKSKLLGFSETTVNSWERELREEQLDDIIK